jgi:hypothetical protein
MSWRWNVPRTAAGEQTLESRAANPPVFRTAMGQLTAVLREGQTTQAIMGIPCPARSRSWTSRCRR